MILSCVGVVHDVCVYANRSITAIEGTTIFFEDVSVDITDSPKTHTMQSLLSGDVYVNLWEKYHPEAPEREEFNEWEKRKAEMF